LSVGRGVLVSWAAGGVRHHEARRVHGCPDALGRPRQDHGAGQQRRVLARPDNQLRAAEDLVRGVRVLGELTVGAMRPFLSVGRRVGHTTSTRRAAQARISPSHGAQPPSLLLRRRRLLLLPPSLWPFPANHLTPVLCHRLRAQITPDRPGRRASRTWHTLPFSREVMRSASGSPTTCPRAFPLRYLMTRTRSIQANPSPNGRTKCGETPADKNTQHTGKSQSKRPHRVWKNARSPPGSTGPAQWGRRCRRTCPSPTGCTCAASAARTRRWSWHSPARRRARSGPPMPSFSVP
jgi:hypothetical protein